MAIKYVFRLVASHPRLEHAEVFGILTHVGKRHLMGSEGSLNRQAVYYFWPGPALGSPEHNHRPGGPPFDPILACIRLDPADVGITGVQHRCKCLMYERRIAARDEVRLVATSAVELGEFFVGGARFNRRAGDLVTVQMENR